MRRLLATRTRSENGHGLSWLDYCFEYEVVAMGGADNDKSATAPTRCDCDAYSRRCAITNKKKRHGRCNRCLRRETRRVSLFTIHVDYPRHCPRHWRYTPCAAETLSRPQRPLRSASVESGHLCKPPALRYTELLLSRESISPHVQRIFPLSSTSR